MLTNARRLCVARRGSAAAAQPLWLPSERRSFLDGFFRRCTARCLESCHRLRVMPPARLLHPRRATYTVADRHQIFDPDNRSVSCALDPNDPIRAIGLQRGRGHATTSTTNPSSCWVLVGSGAHSGGSHCESWQWGWQWEPPL